MKMFLYLGLCSVMLTSSCIATKARQKVSIERHNQDDQAALEIHQARALYDLGEIEAAISKLSQLLDKGAYNKTLDDAYVLAVEWLLSANRYDEAKRYASYFLMHHQKSKSADRIVSLFRDYDAHHQEKSSAPTQMEEKKEAPAEQEIELDLSQGEKSPGYHGQRVAPPDENCLGILLPLSGPFAPFGKKALIAMSSALNLSVPDSSDQIRSINHQGLKLLIADTKGDPHETRALISKLVDEHRAALLIGEITNDASIAAAQKCMQLAVPLISLSRHPLPRMMGKYVFAFSSSPTEQVAHLVDQAMRRGHKRFGILYPRHNYGISMANAFYDEVTNKGGQITALEDYDAHETTFTEPVKKLVGQYFLKTRPEYSECLKNPRALLKARGVKNCKDALAPLVDFDALFIPDYKLDFIIPALVQADMLISKSQDQQAFSKATKIADVKHVQLLGAGSWNDQATIEKIGRMANGALFVDAVNLEDQALKPLKESFINQQLGAPTALEVFAHDALKLAVHILKMPPQKKPHRDLILERLARYEGSVPLLKNIRFSKNNELLSQNISFEINDGQQSVVSE